MQLSLGSERVPGVIVTLSASDLPMGVMWVLTASYDSPLGESVSYQPRGASGTGSGAQVVLVDFAAPIRTPITYTLAAADTTSSAITRPAPGDDYITTLDGGLCVQVGRLVGDERGPQMRQYVTEVPGSVYAPIRRSPVAGAGSVRMSLMTQGLQTIDLNKLLQRNCLVYVLHDARYVEDDIPMVELAKITEARSTKSSAKSPRLWALTYLPCADPQPDLRVGISTWGDIRARNLTWGDVRALGLTVAQANATDWESVA